MAEPMISYIPEAFIHSDDSEQYAKTGGAHFTLRLSRVSVSNEQFGKLMDILERASSEAKAVIGR